MLLTELILSKRGPLAKVWLSAHHERKLTKQQALNVDVEQSVEAILTQDDGPTTLRISGQLMLGVTRIYSRKVQYLLDDCKDTRERIALAFRPGIVDLPEDQAKANKNAITFTDVQNDFDFLDWSWNAPPIPETQLGETTDATTTLALKPKTLEFGAYNFGRPAASSIFGGSSVSRQPSQDDSSSHLDSHDFSGIDLGLNLEDELEAGRHVARAPSVMSDRTRARESTIDGLGKDGEADPLDNFDPLPAMENENEMGFDQYVNQGRRREGSVASSALSTPPPQTPDEEGHGSLSDITPRTAARIAQLGPRGDKPAKRLRLARADAQLELEDAYFANPAPDAPIFGEERYIPADPSAIALNELLNDPASFFLPIRDVDNQQMIFAGPHDLAPELAQLFAFPTNILRRNREVDEAQGDGQDRAAKRARLDAGQGAEEDQMDIEDARRQSVLPLDMPDQEGMGDESFNMNIDAGPDDIIDPFNLATPRKSVAPTMREVSLAPSRADSLARQIQYAEGGDYPLAIFDARTAAAAAAAEDSQLGSQATPTKSSLASSEQRTRGGYSKNTGMAMGLLRREIEKIEEEDKVVKMSEVAEKASKRAASTFFFELLVLGTRDCVALAQSEASGDIEVRAKDRLWDEITA